MATSQQVKEAADAVDAAKAAEAVAQAALDQKFADALALIPNEKSALDAATDAYATALNSAFATVGYNAVLGTLNDASVVRENAVAALVQATAAYDGV